jgi:hypothetical protein
MPFTAELCRAKPLECAERASGSNRYEMKIQQHGMAQQWRSMAEQLERTAAQQASENRWCQLAGSAWTGRPRPEVTVSSLSRYRKTTIKIYL